MSDLAATGLIGALLIAGMFLVFLMAITLNRTHAEIVTGVIGGVRVPRKFRWWMVLQVQAPTIFGGAAFCPDPNATGVSGGSSI